MEKYKNLFNLSSKLEKVLKLKKKEGSIINFNIDTIPDDRAIKITVVPKRTLKSINTTITIGKRGKSKRNENDT